jgi:hypothetical protein
MEERMKLQYGISGFFDRREAITPSVNGNEFKKICHSITAALTHCKLIDYKEPLLGTNFYHASISILDTVMHILLNAQYPIMTFASLIEPFNIIFIDSLELLNQFGIYYVVVSSDEMNDVLQYMESKDGFVIGNDNDLNKAELKQIRYWKPKTVGEIVFNFWG